MSNFNIAIELFDVYRGEFEKLEDLPRYINMYAYVQRFAESRKVFKKFGMKDGNNGDEDEEGYDDDERRRNLQYYDEDYPYDEGHYDDHEYYDEDYPYDEGQLHYDDPEYYEDYYDRDAAG